MLLQRQKNENGTRFFGARVSVELYKDIEEWALAHRLTVSAAACELMRKAISAERGNGYTQRYSQSAPPAQSAIPGGDFKAAFDVSPAQTPPQKRDYGVPSSFKEAFIAPSDDGEEPYQY